MSTKSFLSLSALLFSCVLLFSYFQPSIQSVAANATAKAPITVVIDAGHGGKDVGAVGINGAFEKDLNLLFASTLAEIFRENGACVILTRESDELVLKAGEENAPSKKACDVRNRTEIANSAGCDLFISLHMNSFPTEKYKGFEAYYSPNAPESRLYAERIQEKVKERHEPESRRVARASDKIYLLANAECPAVLLECGFLSNGEDAQKLSSKDYQKELCFSIFCAIMEVKEKLEAR